MSKTEREASAKVVCAIKEVARLVSDSEGRERRLLYLKDAQTIAHQYHVSLNVIDRAALENRICPVRYLRNLGTLGWEGQLELSKARVAVVGAGGLGGFIIEGLARLGVGSLVVIDADVAEESNLNRQLVVTEKSLSRSKVVLAQERVRRVNSAVDVNPRQLWADRSNLAELLAGIDVAVDALDTLPARYMLQEVAQAQRVPLVHGAVGGYTGQVMTIMPRDPGLKALYGAEPEREAGLERVLGNPVGTVMMVAAWQIQEVSKILTGTGELLRNRLLLLDAESGTVEQLEIALS
jgi:molybdopterin/thiamine biosynthesis adenylyltransferase